MKYGIYFFFASDTSSYNKVIQSGISTGFIIDLFPMELDSEFVSVWTFYQQKPEK